MNWGVISIRLSSKVLIHGGHHVGIEAPLVASGEEFYAHLIELRCRVEAIEFFDRWQVALACEVIQQWDLNKGSDVPMRLSYAAANDLARTLDLRTCSAESKLSRIGAAP